MILEIIVSTFRLQEADWRVADIWKCIFLNESYRILFQISLKCVPVTQLTWGHVNIGSAHVAFNRQAITWTNVDPDLCRHMVPLDHNELS